MNEGRNEKQVAVGVGEGGRMGIDGRLGGSELTTGSAEKSETRKDRAQTNHLGLHPPTTTIMMDIEA